MSGTLYLVATPIGNLDDITHRAVRILSEVDLIACEDTRHTRKLLNHLKITNSILSYHEHNEVARTTQLLNKLEQAMNIALVSDAGTPLVSDPGYHLVRKALKKGIPVVPIPGPSAVLTALAASGLPSDSFHFFGFMPSRATQRRKVIGELKDINTTVILYEAPHRILDTLADIDKLLGDRPVVVAREMTKLHEEFLRGTAAEIKKELASRSSVKGEFTVLIATAIRKPKTEAPPNEVKEAVIALMNQGISRMDAMKSVAREHGLSKSAIYRIMEEAKPGDNAPLK